MHEASFYDPLQKYKKASRLTYININNNYNNNKMTEEEKKTVNENTMKCL